MNSLTLKDVKRNNYSLIYRLLYHEKKLSKQDLANRLRLSLPTVSQNLNQLESQGLVRKSGLLAGQVGRKAVAYSLCEKARVAVGVEIQRDVLLITAVDIYGRTFLRKETRCVFRDESGYYEEVGRAVLDFLAEMEVTPGAVLGIGFAVQALASADGREITYGKILYRTGMLVDELEKGIKLPCSFIHDARCAATAELWFDRKIKDAVYLSVGKHLGGALIMNRRIHQGSRGCSGAIEHMTLVRDGRDCYCGGHGCMEAYCSLEALLQGKDTLPRFFERLRAGEAEYVRRWTSFLEDLSVALNDLYAIFDVPCILGGSIAPYITKDDIDSLHERVFSRTAFPNPQPFIKISNAPADNVAVGAALPYIRRYLDSV
ncbi:N-acetylmannosamine kinase [Caprobacter fermentans]|uniref:N-acetylmannosamine kinase n=1 Tax=Caproicibacter fermentans TaxID=2576756 RepID=A0A6N8HUP3_9FIRM|nr:ROK family transcriptional regulator [Caproicibacter fermentans]MVB09496.1 N-acetylmannosamine kinase [Caproicibacter fermentans]QNK41448.1 ROK family transcriptional regulator [Caproicibacter fermentans]